MNAPRAETRRVSLLDDRRVRELELDESIMSEENMAERPETADGIGRRGLMGGAVALLAPRPRASSAAGVRSAAAADETPSDASAPPAKSESKALTSMETWGGSLALQAATYAAPLVAMYNLRATVCFGPKAKAPPGTIWKFEDIATPKLAAESGYVSPNVNVVYGFGFADLGQEPYHPHRAGLRRALLHDRGRRHVDPRLRLSGRRPVRLQGRHIRLVGPGWKGDLPAGVTRIDCPTRWIEFQPRVNVKNEADLPGALEVLRGDQAAGAGGVHRRRPRRRRRPTTTKRRG